MVCNRVKLACRWFRRTLMTGTERSSQSKSVGTETKLCSKIISRHAREGVFKRIFLLPENLASAATYSSMHYAEPSNQSTVPFAEKVGGAPDDVSYSVASHHYSRHGLFANEQLFMINKHE